MVTSVVTLTEYGVKPFIENRPELVQDFKDLVHQLGIDMVNIDERTAERAYQLRAKYPTLKGMDALQLGAARISGSQVFLTNDKRLSQVAEIVIVIIDELLEEKK